MNEKEEEEWMNEWRGRMKNNEEEKKKKKK